MDRTTRTTSRLRAMLLTSPARILAGSTVLGLALGAGAVAVLDELGFSVVRSGEQEYVRVDTPNPGERALLPVETGEGAGLVDLLENGSSLLTLEEPEQLPLDLDRPAGEAKRAPRIFRAGPDGLVPADGGPAGGALIRTRDGNEHRIGIPEPRD